MLVSAIAIQMAVAQIPFDKYLKLKMSLETNWVKAPVVNAMAIEIKFRQ
jgi:hypothetical protein